MSNIYQFTDNLNFDNIILYTPKAVQGGGYHAKIKINNEDLYIQTPKIKTKNGINVTGKKVYSDLLFERGHLEFIEFIEKIETKIQKIVCEKASLWFTEEPTLEQIQSRWNTTVKTYKTNNFLLRTNINNNAKDLSLKIWDEHENMLSYTDVKKENDIIAIVEIVGLKFSTSNFQLVMQLKQIMKFDDEKRFSKCLIKTSRKKETFTNTMQENVKENNTDFSDIHNELNDNESNENDNESNEIQSSDNDGGESSGYSSSGYSSSDSSSGYSESDDSSLSNDDNSDEEIDNENKVIVSSVSPIEESNKDYKNEKGQLDNDVVNNDSEYIQKIVSDNNIETKIKESLVGKKQEPLEKNHINDKMKSNILEEVDLEISSGDTITLKKKRDIYIDIYKKALDKAKIAKKRALKAYFIANKIKKEYLLDDIESTDGEDLENFSE